MAALIRGRYEPLHIAGRGGQAEVVRAIDRLHERPVAIKIRRVRTDEERAAVLAEARLLFGLRPHPGISFVREDFFVRNRYHLVMDWVDGRNLEHRLAEDGPMELGEALSYLSQVADALDHLHGSKPAVVHKDVKPANIVVDATGRTVLVDFGLAQSGPGQGTPGYTAPEIMAGGAAVPASDIFGLAATTLALLTGKSPGADVTIEIPEPHGPRLAAVIRRGMSLRPDERPASASALVAALRPPAAANNLPAPLTSFVGRALEVSTVERLLRSSRLVTLVGPGGAGKTRLAVEAARGLLGEYTAVWLAELVAATDRASVGRTVAAAAGVREDSSPEQAVATRFGRARVLLVLDNCEHVVGPIAELVEELLIRCPNLRVVATSRQAVGVNGEVLFDVGGLDLPEDEVSTDVLAATAAVHLFIERAVEAQPRFRFDLDTAPDVITICRRLDGIPLALELAASQLRRRHLRDLVEDVELRLPHLDGARRTGPVRHRTLEASIEWSAGLLDERSQALFPQLSVFVGGFRPESVAGVCMHGASLPTLVSASLVAACPGTESRFRLHEPVRQHAMSRLDEGGEGELARDRHAAWFAGWACSVAADLERPGEQRALEELEADEDNLRAAFARLVEVGQAAGALRLVTALVPFSEARGRLAERRLWFDAVIEHPGIDPLDRARGCVGLTRIAYAQGDFLAATAAAHEAIAVFGEHADSLGRARAQHALGIVTGEAGDLDTALELFETALTTGRAEGDDLLVARVLTVTGQLAQRRSEYRLSRSRFEDALSIATSTLGPRLLAFILANVGMIDLIEHDLDRAEDRFRHSLDLAQEVGDQRSIGVVLRLLGHLEMAKGQPGRARDFYAEAITVWREQAMEHLMGWDLDNIGEAYSVLGDHRMAAAAFGAAEAVRSRVGSVVDAYDAEAREQRLVATREALGDERFDEAWTEGGAVPTDQIDALLPTR